MSQLQSRDREGLNYYARPAKERNRLANHGMVMGETLGGTG